MQNENLIGKKVRITDLYENYIGQIGKIIGVMEFVFEVEMEDGETLFPYRPELSLPSAQCEYVTEPEQQTQSTFGIAVDFAQYMPDDKRKLFIEAMAKLSREHHAYVTDILNRYSAHRTSNQILNNPLHDVHVMD